MTERSIFNVVCKLGGLWMLLKGLSFLLWELLASRTSHEGALVPLGSGDLLPGLVYVVAGFALITCSARLTRLAFRMDGPLCDAGSSSLENG